jgi:5'-nucleotidase
VRRFGEHPLPERTLVNVNCPAGEVSGIEVTKLGKRLYDDELKLVEEGDDGRRRYRIYGFEPSFEDEPGTDLAAQARGRISLTPLHFDLTHHGGLDPIREWDLDGLLGAATKGVART